MSVIIFIAVLAVLILVHECGHFLAARSVGARVDEFGIGFPPRVWAYKPKNSQTTYSINWIPFGGFVKILGEDGESGEAAPDSLVKKSKLAQLWVLSAGVIFNFIFAWLLLSIGFMSGLPSSVTPETQGLAGAPEVTILAISPDSPAQVAGILPGDVIVSLTDTSTTLVPKTVEEVQTFIGNASGHSFELTYEREKTRDTVTLTPRDGIVPGKGAIGVSLDLIGTLKLNPLSALWEGAHTSVLIVKSIAQSLWGMVWGALRGTGNFSEVAGPVGIVGLVGDAARRGIIALLSFTALISLNLALINLIPFPALDGGRILFVAIEAIKGSPIKPKVTGWANGIGFAILILLMLAITIHDVVQLIAS